MNINNIQKAIDIFKKGGVVVFPTDTAYGIGCRMDNKESVEKVFKIKKRSLSEALLVLADSLEMLTQYVEVPNDVKEKLIDKYWPGGLTIFLKTHEEKVLPIVTAGTQILAVRIPGNPELRDMIAKVGVPIIATSANTSGKETPYSLDQVEDVILKQVDFVLEGECRYKKESTIINTTISPWKIIRNGVVEIAL